MAPDPRIFAIDWSGAIKGSRKKIWLAEISGGRLISLTSGRDRIETTDYIIAASKNASHVIVGLDFAFSCPEWFVKWKDCESIHQFWSLAETQGEQWMKEWPFWSKGRPERKPPDEYRACERAVPATASSIFKLVGPSQVGRGSIRGMPHLLKLHRCGFSIWPFDVPKLPFAVESYPRLFTEGVVKKNPAARKEFLEKFSGRSDVDLKQSKITNSDDAFDAIVSAFAMSDNLDNLRQLKQSKDRQILVEGAIWFPQP